MPATLPLVGIPAGTTSLQSMPGRPVYRSVGTYSAALAAAGAAPVLIPLNLPEPTLHAVFLRLDGLCLSGGGDVDPIHYRQAGLSETAGIDPARDAVELTLVRWALESDLPLLGICRGIQVINVAAGGELWQDVPSQLAGALRHNYQSPETPRERAVHEVRVSPDTRLAGILKTPALRTNSFHHQAVSLVARGFVSAAWAGDGVIEAIEAPAQRFALGVQWHPEDMVAESAEARQLFAAFVAAGRARLLGPA